MRIEREKFKIEINMRPDAFFPGVVLLRYTCCTSFQLGWWGYAVILLIMNNAPQCLSRAVNIVCVCSGPREAIRQTRDTLFMIQCFFLFWMNTLIAKMTFIGLIAYVINLLHSRYSSRTLNSQPNEHVNPSERHNLTAQCSAYCWWQ